MLCEPLPHMPLDDLGANPGKPMDVSVCVTRGQGELWHVALLPEALSCVRCLALASAARGGVAATSTMRTDIPENASKQESPGSATTVSKPVRPMWCTPQSMFENSSCQPVIA
jgi:hypothetical protein